ncbi:Highly reducing polyketide synthase curS1 [Colletotrichum gloeosporioides]|uniref:Highly reducing polyketide synthase curS1 n=1 Tax=Colletotrichum gloeosporioides TaxID=474922 RepID=A0A8H4CL73_COLGL|nr:Highly reducing polyketide synthase curS1 [Colletotrichum gloeosporioides]KAF3805844.1 Highly reducing polyketide synthase curS1 [Colletotrichum gloeosporioides]
MHETQTVWLSFLRLEDEPWRHGHKVGSTVLLPGAGMTSIIPEASQHVVASKKHAQAFRLRDVFLFVAMARPERVATEVFAHMRLRLQFTIGLNPAPGQLPWTHDDKLPWKYDTYHRIHKVSNLEYAYENFYNHMNSTSWKFGEVFQ